MKTKKLLSVIAAASLAMTSFAALAVTASAADYSAYDLIYQFDEGTDIILNAGDTIYAYEVDTVLSVYDDSTGEDWHIGRTPILFRAKAHSILSLTHCL